MDAHQNLVFICKRQRPRVAGRGVSRCFGGHGEKGGGGKLSLWNDQGTNVVLRTTGKQSAEMVEKTQDLRVRKRPR